MQPFGSVAVAKQRRPRANGDQGVIHLYGIPNCDTVKKARLWLDAAGKAYTFHDYKKEGADPDRIAGWIAAAGLDVVVNRKGTTFRALSDADKARAADAASAHAGGALFLRSGGVARGVECAPVRAPDRFAVLRAHGPFA